MKRSPIHTLLLSSAVMALACGGSDVAQDQQGQTEQARAALSVSSTIPVPMTEASGTLTREPAWQRSIVDLKVADVWSQCGFVADDGIPIDHMVSGEGDLYLRALSGHMQQAMAKWAPRSTSDANPRSTLEQWRMYRSDDRFNDDSSTGVAKPAKLKLLVLGAYNIDQIAQNPIYRPAYNRARSAIGMAGMNLCIAQAMRQYALSGEMLLLSEADQQQLLEVVRERAQISMLQFAAIGNILAAEPYQLPTGAILNEYQAVPYIQQWAILKTRGGALGAVDTIKAWGRDFATSVQLQITATQDLAELFGRSASAKAPRGGHASNSAEEQWGGGSWRQRLFALLYGGDPLAEAMDKSTPWTNMVGKSTPGITLDSSVRQPEDWPVRADFPYVETDVRDPHASRFLALAMQYDELKLYYRSYGQDLDATTTADRMYRAVEARLRTSRCAETVNVAAFTNECKVFGLSDIPKLNLEALQAVTTSGVQAGDVRDFLLWKEYEIAPAHAIAGVKMLNEKTPHLNSSAMVSGAAAASQVLGAFAIAAGSVQQISEQGVQVSKDAVFIPRSLVEIASAFGSLAPYRMPAKISGQVELAHPLQTPTQPPETYRVGDDQGLSAGGVFSEAMRVVGAVPALAVVRETLRVIEASKRDVPEAFLKGGAKAVGGVIDAAVGNSSVLVRPREYVDSVDWAAANYVGGKQTWEVLQTTNAATTPDKMTVGWQIAVVPGSTDPFWNGNASEYSSFAIPDAPFAYALAQSPQSTYEQYSIASLLSGQQTVLGQRVVVGIVDKIGTSRAELSFNLPTTMNSRWTFVVKRKQAAGESYRALTGQMRLTAWEFNTRRGSLRGMHAPIDGQYIATGGVLGNLARRAIARQASNPHEPAYDGFGLPTTWVPPTDPSAYGAGENQVAYLLRNAKTAASEATEAVKTAFDGLIAAQKDSSDVQAAKARASAVMQMEQERLCGAAKSCPQEPVRLTELVVTQPYELLDARTGQPRLTTKLTAPEVSSARAVACDAARKDEKDQQRTARKLKCLELSLLERLLAPVRVAAEVVALRDAPSQPGFEVYEGGLLQGNFIRQWAALRKIRDLADALHGTAEANRSEIEVADATLQEMEAGAEAAAAKAKAERARISFECGEAYNDVIDAYKIASMQCDVAYKLMLAIDTNMQQACLGKVSSQQSFDECYQRGQGEATFGTKPSAQEQLSMTSGMAACYAGLQEASKKDRVWKFLTYDKCKELEDLQTALAAVDQKAAAAAKSQTFAVAAEAEANLLRFATTLTAAAGELAEASAEGAALVNSAQLAARRQELEGTLLAQFGQVTSFNLYRQYHHYDLWRARALIDGARRYSVAARRAIEARYLVDISKMLAPEPFVAAPSAWADGVYKYDLDMPAAVGLSVGDPGGGIYPNQVTDYVGNLEKLVQGFGIARPVSPASNDSDVIALPGPLATVSAGTEERPDPGRAAWSVLCPKGAKCSSGGDEGWCSATASGSLDLACESVTSTPQAPIYLAPLGAKTSFFLDPWGRPVLEDGQAPYSRRVNARWGVLAVNLVGAEVRDCNLAGNKRSCAAEAFLRYNLKHIGPAAANGYDKQWHVLDIPVAVVEAGKAIAKDDVLDALTGWSKPYAEAAARSEFIDRPLGGVYELEIVGDASTRFDRIEQVQILMRSNYWVLQE